MPSPLTSPLSLHVRGVLKKEATPDRIPGPVDPLLPKPTATKVDAARDVCDPSDAAASVEELRNVDETPGVSAAKAGSAPMLFSCRGPADLASAPDFVEFRKKVDIAPDIEIEPDMPA